MYASISSYAYVRRLDDQYDSGTYMCRQAGRSVVTELSTPYTTDTLRPHIIPTSELELHRLIREIRGLTGLVRLVGLGDDQTNRIIRYICS